MKVRQGIVVFLLYCFKFAKLGRSIFNLATRDLYQQFYFFDKIVIVFSQLHETLALHSLNIGSEYLGLLKRQEKMSFELLANSYSQTLAS